MSHYFGNKLNSFSLHFVKDSWIFDDNYSTRLIFITI